MKISKGHIENKLNFAVKNTIFLILTIAVVAGTIPTFAEALESIISYTFQGCIQ